MSESRPVEPVEVARMVEQHIESELSDAAKYSNRVPLDESGVFNLHSLAAQIYARGFNDGRFVEAEKSGAQRRRDRDKAATNG